MGGGEVLQVGRLLGLDDGLPAGPDAAAHLRQLLRRQDGA
ncbi:hypothetical protein SAMN04488546_1749 [Geodermatophilus poikilotrophus]|uniref:Uncharacterized protein n=2 Tax=Geodermatophilus poikilotrophus TaxID=1333667 RepID=A0A1I0CST8_9ACTN|nr:hypothetical protein SAMN04488546_1749 [Geodermatophilus poikilotrophus]